MEEQMTKQKTLLSLTLLLSLLLAACASAQSIDGTAWRMVELGGQPALLETAVTLTVEGEKVGGSDGCNVYGGSVKVDGSQIKFGDDMVSTMMACQEAIMLQTNAFYAALRQADSYTITNDQLTLLDTNGDPLAVFAVATADIQ